MGDVQRKGNSSTQDGFDPMSDPQERRVLSAAIDSFRQYRHTAHYNITHLRRQSFYSLPSKHMEILCKPPFSLPQTFDLVDEAIDRNADISEAILQNGLSMFGTESSDMAFEGKATPHDMEKARATIRQLYRDWSAEGSSERLACYVPILDALAACLPEIPAQRHWRKVLVPGAGLGRLVFEICKAGFSVEGNEISYHQLLASNYLLNCTHKVGQHTLYPWALNYSNHLTRSNQLQRVSIPDILPSAILADADEEMGAELPFSGRITMTAGDFCVVYKQPEYSSAFDAVATCFFIDTAPNFINYIETVKHCLKPGGVWINLGPLLWHFESVPTPAEREKQRHGHMHHHEHDPEAAAEGHNNHAEDNKGIGEAGSFELSEGELIKLLEHFGFEITEHDRVIAAGYIQDPRSILQNIYHPSFWVARKK